MNLTDELYLCDNGNVLSNKDKLLEIGRLLGVEAQTCNEIPNKGWDMVDSEMEGRKLLPVKYIFKQFSDKLLTLFVQINQLFTYIMMYREQRFTSHPSNI